MREHKPKSNYGVPLQMKHQGSPEVMRATAPMHPSMVMQLQRSIGNRAVMQLVSEQARMQENTTGMPDQLKQGLEHISGLSMSDVKVHYNSDKPQAIGALGYAQGTDIHLSPGQESHLQHEAWHVVQQKQGRVSPTTQIEGQNINADSGLEQEADEMGNKAAAFTLESNEVVSTNEQQLVQKSSESYETVQRVPGLGAVVTTDTVLHKKRSINGEEIEKVKEGQVCIEIGQPSVKWTKVKVQQTGKTGWILREHITYEPSLDVTKDSETQKFDHPEHVGKVEGMLHNENGITGKDVSQGGLGDCWLLSPLAAIANSGSGKQLIREMIQDNKDDTYTVRFYVPVEEGSEQTNETLVTVNAFVPTSEEGADTLYAQKTNTNAIWPLIVEKAYAEVKGGFHGIEGGFISDAFLVLTGNRSAGHSLEERVDKYNPTTQTDIGVMATKLKGNKGNPISLSIPPIEKELDIIFKKNQGDYISQFIGNGAKEDTVKITYTNDKGESKKLTGKKDGIEMIDFPEYEFTFIKFNPTGIVGDDDLTARLWCQLTDLENGISGGHAYWLYDFEENDTPEECVLHLTDPRKPSEVIEITLDEIYTEHKARIFIGDTKKQS